MEKRVLLIDSDPVFIDQVTRGFEALQISVQAVRDDTLAINKARSARPDLIVLSDLPDRNIFAVCNRVKRTAGLTDVPLVLLCAETTPQAIDAHRTSRSPAEEYLQKPIAIAQLIGAVGKYLSLDEGALEEASEIEALPDDDEPMVPAARGSSAVGPPPMQKPPPMPKSPPPMPKPGAFSSGGTQTLGTPQPRGNLGGAGSGPVALRSVPDPFLEAGPDPRPPMSGSPEEKLKFFRDRVKARDDLIQKVRALWTEREELFRQLQLQLGAMSQELASERENAARQTAGLQAELAQQHEAAQGLERGLVELQRDVAALKARAEAAEEKLTDAEGRAKSLSEVLNDSLQEREESDKAWSTRVAEAEKVSGEARSELTGLREAKAQLDQSLELNLLELRETKTILGAEQARAAGLAQDLDDARRDLETQVTALREETATEVRILRLETETQRKSLEAELEATRGRLEDELADVRGTLGAQVAELSGELAASREDAGQKALDLEHARGRIDDLESRLGDAEQRAENSLQEGNAIREQHAAQEREIEALRAELTSLGARATQLEADLVVAREQVQDEAERAEAQAEARIGQLTAQAADRIEQAQRAQEQAAALVSEREVELADSRQELEGLRGELDQALGRVSERDHQLEQAKRAIGELKAKGEKALKEAAARGAEADSLRASVQSAGGSAAQLQAQIAQRDALVAAAQTQLGQREQSLGELKAQLAQHDQTVAAHVAAISQRDAQLADVKNQLMRMDAERKQLKHELSQLRAAPAARGGDEGAQVAALRVQLAELQQQAASSKGGGELAAKYKAERDKAAAAYERAREEASRAKRALERLGSGGGDPAELERLRNEVASISADRERLQDDLAGQLADLAGAMAAKDSELAAVKRRAQQIELAARGQAEVLERRFAEQITKLATGAEGDIADALRQRIAGLQEEKKALEARAAAAPAGPSADAQAEIERLLGEIDDLKGENSFLGSEVDRYAGELQELQRYRDAAEGPDAERTREIQLKP